MINDHKQLHDVTCLPTPSGLNRPGRLKTFEQKLRRMRRDEDGSIIIFSLFMVVCMLVAVGIAIDVQRFEVARTKLQNTLDRAVLAAADLDQTMDPKQVVDEYFDKAGLGAYDVNVVVDQGLNYRTVSGSTEAEVNALFGNFTGMKTLSAPASGSANETVMDVEISLVLDNSGSMASTVPGSGKTRLQLLQAAANDFVDTVIQEAADEETISISIIPFATQVSVGPDLMQYYNVTNEHDYSYCVNFDASDFETTTMYPAGQTLKRTGHFDVQSYSKPLRNKYLTCPTDSSRHILAYENDPDVIKAKINSMWAGGNTSIDIATKWGATLLDPSTRSVIYDMIDDGLVHNDFSGRPYDYDEPEVMKVLIVMSDGQNTSQYYLKDPYRDGNSKVYLDEPTGKTTYYYNRRNTSYDYFWNSSNQWKNYPYYNWDRAKRLTYPELWNTMSVAYYARYVEADARGGSMSNYFYNYYSSVSGSTKMNRTSNICKAAREAGPNHDGIKVYTIGMDTYGDGDATLLDCVGGVEANFFDVEGLEIDDAFSAIARQINMLRLTH